MARRICARPRPRSVSGGLALRAGAGCGNPYAYCGNNAVGAADPLGLYDLGGILDTGLMAGIHTQAPDLLALAILIH